MAVSAERLASLVSQFPTTDALFDGHVSKKCNVEEYKEALSALMAADIAAAREEERAAIAAVESGKVFVKANPSQDKRTISLYGLQRQPITLYRGQWDRMITAGLPAVAEFIKTHDAYLPADKKATPVSVPKELIGATDKPFRVPAERK